jgi:hypothetical protein
VYAISAISSDGTPDLEAVFRSRIAAAARRFRSFFDTQNTPPRFLFSGKTQSKGSKIDEFTELFRHLLA